MFNSKYLHDICFFIFFNCIFYYLLFNYPFFIISNFFFYFTLQTQIVLSFKLIIPLCTKVSYFQINLQIIIFYWFASFFVEDLSFVFIRFFIIIFFTSYSSTNSHNILWAFKVANWLFFNGRPAYHLNWIYSSPRSNLLL